jgi:hypothetical protein
VKHRRARTVGEGRVARLDPAEIEPLKIGPQRYEVVGIWFECDEPCYPRLEARRKLSEISNMRSAVDHDCPRREGGA